jgi:hypothetical protein
MAGSARPSLATATASRKPKGYDIDLGQAQQFALKEAETNAVKRALMTFGNPFRLALCDKRQRDVTSSAVQECPEPQARS